ncbi:MAG: heme exporter protein CcmD [Rhodospirillaceae bacterium]|jgi:heme exporter protein D|nr:heme exporter protein CcmD [Rhodospirillaceae bacterium]|tara:strand:- start:1472 stop:1642 length:171 start_codon:yes stop_codon:yes gene_type:complete
MDALTSFFNMGGYAGFIWPAYAIAAAVLAGLLVISRRSLRDAERRLDKLTPPEDGQ